MYYLQINISLAVDAFILALSVHLTSHCTGQWMLEGFFHISHTLTSGDACSDVMFNSSMQCMPN